MKKNIVYLYPEVEGQQEFVCWGFKKEDLKKDNKKEIQKTVVESLQEVSEMSNSWISKRSFSVFLGEDNKDFWVAIPRQLSVKVMKNLNNKFAALNLQTKIVITSYENPFGEKYPFSPMVSYDRGFIVDSTKINEKLANSQAEIVVNI